jgi:3-deoxy-D-manno-octulosonic-acid transferase
LSFVLRLVYAGMARLAGVLAVIVPEADSKATLAIRARRGIRRRYARWAAEHRDPARQLVWMHAPSVGEGLQARPVLRLLRERHADAQLAYTFFSPSAEEFSRGLDVDFRDYLPFDAAGDMRAALDALRPRVLVFSKLDVWPELVRQAKRRGVRVAIVSATLAAASSRRSRFARALLHETYARMDAVGAIDHDDAERLVELGVRRDVIEVTGDTRFDQVWQRATTVDRASRVLAMLASAVPTLVAGSTWPSDEAPLMDAFSRARGAVGAMRLIIAPHEMRQDHLASIESACADRQLRVRRVDDATARDADVVLVDRFGILGDLYALADVAFVGGGFHDAGLHSVLEPAAFGAPVLFGPKHTRSRDALLLLAAGAAASVNDATELERALTRWVRDVAARAEAGREAKGVVERNLGAAERSLRIIERLLAD